MTLINRGAVEVAGTWKFLPPYNLVVQSGLIHRVVVDEIPLYAEGAAGYLESYNRVHGREFALSGFYNLANPAAGLAFKAEMESWFFNTDGRPNTVQFCEWVDSADTGTRVWRNCTIQEGFNFDDGSRRTVRSSGFSFRLRTPYWAYYSSAADATKPDAGSYEKYLYSGSSTPTGITVVNYNAPSIRTGVFLGEIDAVTSASNDQSRQHTIILHPSKAILLKGLRIASANQGIVASGNTVLVLSTLAYTSPPPAGSYLTATLAYNASSTAWATGSIAVALNTAVYVYITGEANHQDLTYEILWEPNS